MTEPKLISLPLRNWFDRWDWANNRSNKREIRKFSRDKIEAKVTYTRQNHRIINNAKRDARANDIAKLVMDIGICRSRQEVGTYRSAVTVPVAVREKRTLTPLVCRRRIIPATTRETFRRRVSRRNTVVRARTQTSFGDKDITRSSVSTALSRFIPSVYFAILNLAN